MKQLYIPPKVEIISFEHNETILNGSNPGMVAVWVDLADDGLEDGGLL